MSNTHFKTAINPDYMGAYSMWSDELNGYTEIQATVRLAEMKTVVLDKGKETKLVVYTEHPKPFICNSTSGAEISKAAKSPSYLAWAGAKITIGVKIDQRMRDGSKGPALIVKAGHTSPPKPNNTAEIIKRMEACQTIDELILIWNGLTATEHIEVSEVKEKRKGELLNASK